MAASFKRTKEYLIIAAALFVVSLVAIIIAGASLSGMSVPYDKPSSVNEDIVIRTAALTGNSDSSYRALYRVGSGFYTTGDYVVRSFTSSDYLIKGRDDTAFAQDLSTVISGSSDQSMIAETLGLLNDSSRMFAINEILTRTNSSLKASSNISDAPGDSFTDCVIDSSLEGEGGITLGIRKVEGSFVTTGDGIRTDFFVDGTCYQGNIVIRDQGEGTRSFVMAWNSEGVSPGNHEVLILLRSSDGRGTVIAGGDISVPNTMSLVNYNVQPGSIAEGNQASWYVLDAQDQNAYVNFLNLSGDIRVSLYDAYGNLIGVNDLPGNDLEVLRGLRQDVQTISEDTGLTGVSNTFFVKVERGVLNEDHLGSVSYTMVQSREVAYYDGNMVAVVDDVGPVPTSLPVTGNSSDYYGRQVRVQDMSNNVRTVNYEDLSYIPINGALESLEVKFVGTGVDLSYFPEFSSKLTDYGYMSGDQVESLIVNASAREGNFATVTADLTNSSGVTSLNMGDGFSFAQGENILSVTVSSFDGESKTYALHVLIGDDEGSFCEDTLSQFPVSYGSGLWLLHSLHPNYIFTPYNTGLDFYTVLDYEDSGSRSLANINSNPSWTNSSSPEYDGGGWHAATNEAVRYFLDPRNYLDQNHVFSFETLSFNSSIHTVDGVRAMIRGSFMDTEDIDYAQIIYDAGQTSGISPYLIASRIIQEMGYNGESALCTGTLPGYEGYYNFFNIGSTPDPTVENGALINGARYAMWGSDPDSQYIDDREAQLLLPWDNVEDAITGGAIWISQSYIAIGQNTLYFQKFDVISNNDGLYQHQYAQNIAMAYSEGVRYFRSYASSDMLDEPFEFVIPVYTSLPDSYGHMP
ncbi:MAG: hypothetical protein IJ757_05055 [Clostridiales bacterium]|nr:hypothetical protein [Clostridiales bacterium]